MMNSFTNFLTNMSDCLIKSLSSSNSLGFGFFKQEHQQIQNTSELEKAVIDTKAMIEKIHIDLNMIEEKIVDYYENVIHIQNQTPSKQNHLGQDDRSETEESLVLKRLFEHYRMLVISYPTVSDFKELTLSDINSFVDHLEAHHDLVKDMARNLLEMLDFEVKNIQERFEALPKSYTLSKK